MNLQKGILFISILVFILSCTKIDPGSEFHQAGSAKKSTAAQNTEIEKMRREAASLLDSLRTREKILLQKETSLDSLQYALKLREIMLKEKENTFKIMRGISFIILFIGIIMTAGGAFLLFQVRKKLESGDSPTNEEIVPVHINEAPAATGKEPEMIISPVKAELEKPGQANNKPDGNNAPSPKKRTVKNKVQTGESLKPRPEKTSQQPSPVKPAATKLNPVSKEVDTPKKQIRKSAVSAKKNEKTATKRQQAGSKKPQQTANEKKQP